MKSERALNDLLHDIGPAATFDLEEFIISRVDRIRTKDRNGFLLDACYKKGLADGVLLQRLYGLAQGRRQ